MTPIFLKQNTDILGKYPDYLPVIQVGVWDFVRRFMQQVGPRLRFAPTELQARVATCDALASDEDMGDVKHHPDGLGSR